MFPFSDTRTHRESRLTPPLYPSTDHSPAIRSNLLHIDSRFARANDQRKYVIDLPEPLHQVRRLSVEEVDMSISFFNISNQLENNTIRAVGPSNTFLLVIPDGYYTSASLASAVQTQLNAIDGFSVNVSLQASILTIAATTTPNGDIFSLEWGEPIRTNQISHTLGFILGFRDIRTTLRELVPISGTAPCLVNAVMPYLFLAVEDYTNCKQNQVLISIGGTNTSASSKGSAYPAVNTVLAKIAIPGTPSFGERLVSTTSTGSLTTGIRKYAADTTIRRLECTWIDVMGNPISLNDIPFSICFRIDCE